MSFLLNRLLEENYWVVWWIYILTFQEIDKWFFREEMLECSRSSHPRQHLYFLSFLLQLFKRVNSGISLCWVAFSRGLLMLSIFSSACQLLIDCLCTNIYLNLLLIFIWIIYLFDIKSSLYILDSSSLWDTWFAKFFSSSVTSLFISVKTFFWSSGITWWWSPTCHVFVFMGGTFDIISKNILPTPIHKDLFLLCFFQMFIVSALNISVCYPYWSNFCVLWGKSLNSCFCMYF